MKKMLFVLLLTIFLCGCGNELIKTDCEVITIRPYSVSKEEGLFTTKVNTIDYIEYTYEYNGELHIDTVRSTNLRIGDNTKVLVEESENGIFFDNLYLSLEDYKELYNLN